MALSTTTGESSAGRLRRILGVGFGLAVTIGSTIGLGILRSPGGVAAQLVVPSTIIVLWLVGGLYTLLGAVCLTELGTMAPQAGGYYVYARRAFGDWVGFAVGWTDWITYCAVLGYVSIGMADFLGALIPALVDYERPVAVAVLVGFVALQWAGVRVSSRFQEWATALKCLAFLALIVAGLVMAGRGGPHVAATPAAGGMIAALQLVVITYAGWQSALYFTEEDRDTSRNLPRAMIGGVLAVIVIYVLVNVALLAILPIPELASAKLPASAAAERLLGSVGGTVITVLSVVSLTPLLNAIMMIGTRILFALGRDRLFWSRTADVNAGGTPGIATLVTTVVAILLIVTGTFQRLVAIASFFLALNYAISCVALVVLRRREPGTPRPFRAWAYPWSAVIVVAGALAFLASALIEDSATALASVAVLVVGLLGHAVARTRVSKT